MISASQLRGTPADRNQGQTKYMKAYFYKNKALTMYNNLDPSVCTSNKSPSKIVHFCYVRNINIGNSIQVHSC